MAIKNLDSWAADEKVGHDSLFGSSYVRNEPKGVVLIISPWNYPIQLALDCMVRTNTHARAHERTSARAQGPFPRHVHALCIVLHMSSCLCRNLCSRVLCRHRLYCYPTTNFPILTLRISGSINASSIFVNKIPRPPPKKKKKGRRACSRQLHGAQAIGNVSKLFNVVGRADPAIL